MVAAAIALRGLHSHGYNASGSYRAREQAMATREEEFKQRFAAVLLDLQENGRNDSQAMWLIGSLAAQIAEKAGQASWAEFKQTMSQETYAKLLADFETEGNRQYQEGDRKKAYAIQVLAVSLVSFTQDDEEIQAGGALLDQLIDTTLAVYRDSGQPKPN